jgi:hypothetical protein
MHVGKKGAFVLLAIVVLWAATPALACLRPAAHRSCCEGMAMQGCECPAMMQCGDCCRIQPAGAPLLPGSSGAIDHASGSLPSPAATAQALPPAASSAILHAPEAPLPPGSSGFGSILQI